MSKRPLSKGERRITETSVKRIRDTVEEIEYDIETVERDLDKGLFLKHKAAVKKQKGNLAELKVNLEFNEKKLKICDDQLKFGVEIKPKKEVEKNGNASQSINT